MSHEHAPRSAETPAEMPEVKSTTEIKHHARNRVEHHNENKQETIAVARELTKEAVGSSADQNRPQSEKRQARPHFTSADRNHGFRTVMHHVRQGLNKPEQTFSRIIHQPAIEKTSELAGKTIARPSGVVGAGIAAFTGLLITYSLARQTGFSLSGSETPFLLLVGFLVGLLLEWLFKALRSLFKSRT